MDAPEKQANSGLKGACKGRNTAGFSALTSAFPGFRSGVQQPPAGIGLNLVGKA
jgi:hypothetical protein